MTQGHFDFGTVRLFQVGGFLEAQFPSKDGTAKVAVTRAGGFWVPTRRAYRIDLRGRSSVTVARQIELDLEKSAPPAWIKAVQNMRGGCVTRKFGLVFGVGGIRLRLPSGSVHEYTLKAHPTAELNNREWTIPASDLAQPKIKAILTNVLERDRAQFGESVGYLAGFAIQGALTFEPGDPVRDRIVVGRIVHLSPSIPQKVDKNLEIEPIVVLPARVAQVQTTEDGRLQTKIEFLDEQKAFQEASSWVLSQDPVLDVQHLDGQWRRTRA